MPVSPPRRLALVSVGLAAALSLACGGPPRVDEKIVTSITGQVLDAAGRQPIANALIQTEPFVKQVFTTAEGRFTIDTGLTVGMTYRVSASVDGYEGNSVTISNIVEGTNTVADILLSRRGPRLMLSSTSVQVNAGSTAGTFRIENAGDTSQGLMFTVTAADPWITAVTPASGTVTSIPETVRIDVDRAMLPAGNAEISSNVEVASNGGSGTVVLRIAR
jgi:hypothetical protein